VAPVIAAVTSTAHVRSNASAVGWVLTDADMAEIDRITLQKGRTRTSPDGRHIASRTVTPAFDPRPSYWDSAEANVAHSTAISQARKNEEMNINERS
jgi:hypothetical protein